MTPFLPSNVFQQYALDVQQLLEQHNGGGLTRDDIGRHFAGTPPKAANAYVAHEQKVRRLGNEEFDKARKLCRAMFEAGFDEWGFIWSRRVKGDFRWHLVAKVINGHRTSILSVYPAGQIAQSVGKEFQTRTRSATRIDLAHVSALKNYAGSLPSGPDRTKLLKEVKERLDAVEIRNLRLAALNMDSGMKFEDLEQLANPRDKRLQIFAKQTKLYVDLQKRANKELIKLVQTYETFKHILGKDDPQELGEGAGALDKAKP